MQKDDLETALLKQFKKRELKRQFDSIANYIALSVESGKPISDNDILIELMQSEGLVETNGTRFTFIVTQKGIALYEELKANGYFNKNNS